MSVISKSTEIGGRTLTLEIGRLAEQATGAVLGRYGDTMILATVVSSRPRADLDYFPLSVEYVERLYAGGRIKGSRWVKREGRPSDEAILKARLVDRSIRPLFPKNYKNDVQVIITVLSVDGENDPDVLSIVATSAALAISSIPWNGPIGSLRVGFVPPKNGQEGYFLKNPRTAELLYSDMELVISGTKDKILMLEGQGKEVTEETFLRATDFAKEDIKEIIDLINELVSEVGPRKKEVTDKEQNKKLLKEVEKDYAPRIDKLIIQRVGKEEEGEELTLLSSEILEKYKDEFEKKEIEEVLEYLFKKKVREKILKDGKRPDGRGPKDIRPVSGEVGLLPRTHGSAMFKRGQTQVLTVITLGSPSLEQLIESPTGEETKRYIHHYSMPPYSVGETGRYGFPSRREIGHGALAEWALEPLIPSGEEFPYTIRVVSEIMSSNGSTSMASTCGSTLALMDAGVPLKEPVAGIALGLIMEKDERKKDYVILSDIIGIEDFCGDMDFKIAGTKNGITAVQLDVKIDGLSREIIKETLARGREGRLYILKKILDVLPAPRGEVSKYAPKVTLVHVPIEKIGEVIGPGGKVIRQIIAQTGATVDVEDDGTVTISGVDQAMVAKAADWVKGLTREVTPDEVFEGEVKRILPFGAFVEITPGKEGMVHVSQMAPQFVADPNTVVKVGQKVKVRVVEVDSQGRINLSMLFGADAKPRPPRPPRPSTSRFLRPSFPRRRVY